MTTASDGYGNLVIRDTTNVVGGVPGDVNTCLTAKTLAGKRETAFEWALLAWLDNYSDAGENCALYAQANKLGQGGTWGACIEACDTTSPDTTGLVGAEVDCWVTGADNGLRVGVDVSVGDSLQIRKGQRSAEAVGSIGSRVGASGASPWARWTVGYQAQDFTFTGLHLKSKATRAIHLEGEYIVGLDLSTAKTQSAIRLAPGQRMTFEPTDQISWSWLDGRLRVQNGDVNVLEIDTTTGDIFKRGVKVL